MTSLSNEEGSNALSLVSRRDDVLFEATLTAANVHTRSRLCVDGLNQATSVTQALHKAESGLTRTDQGFEFGLIEAYGGRRPVRAIWMARQTDRMSSLALGLPINFADSCSTRGLR
jgi:hypothetical protein